MKPKALYTISDIFNLIGLMTSYEDLEYLSDVLKYEKAKYKKEVFQLFKDMIGDKKNKAVEKEMQLPSMYLLKCCTCGYRNNVFSNNCELCSCQM